MNNDRIAGVVVLLLAFAASVLSRGQSAQQATGAQSAPAVRKAPWQSKAVTSTDSLVLELPSDQWWEGPQEYVPVSPDGDWALVYRAGSESGFRLYSLKTGQEDRPTLMADLNRVDAAAFCGPHGIARMGERAAEHGWFCRTAMV